MIVSDHRSFLAPLAINELSQLFLVTCCCRYCDDGFALRTCKPMRLRGCCFFFFRSKAVRFPDTNLFYSNLLVWEKRSTVRIVFSQRQHMISFPFILTNSVLRRNAQTYYRQFFFSVFVFSGWALWMDLSIFWNIKIKWNQLGDLVAEMWKQMIFC